MANPTTNYGFVLPTSSDLVTDLPADFDVALQGVDTRLKALQPGTTLGDLAYSSATANTNTRLPIGTNGQVLTVAGGVPTWATGSPGDIEGVTAGVGISGGGTSGTVTVTNSMATAIDAKGDLIVGTGADAFFRLAVGANNTVLTADSAEATGMKWATPSASSPSFTLLNSGGTAMTGAATITVSGISGKNSIFFRIALGSSASASSDFSLRLNADSGANYYYVGNGAFGADAAKKAGVDATGVIFAVQGSDAGNYVNAYGLIDGTNAAGIKPISYGSFSNGSSAGSYTGIGFYSGSSTISSLSIVSSSGNFDDGTLYVYGA